MVSLMEESKGTDGSKVKDLYFDILNGKGTATSFQENDLSMEQESKHIKKLNKKRAKALEKQQRKLKAQDAANGLEEDSDGEIPFFMQDASIRAAMRDRAEEAKLMAKLAKKGKKKKKKDSSSSSDDDSSSSEKKKKKKGKDKKKKDKKKNKKAKKKASSSSSS
eukprot:TRINITY_DN34998_c1_g2_i1.p1 TRINITY_DN34998_c1_g2~~TRINITY_DN34998_c1_g2_i1.p1  ORF type:complete len:164 (-),score=86.52 TRINITY_DN34998_c1_g2_i1:55-546(-)